MIRTEKNTLSGMADKKLFPWTLIADNRCNYASGRWPSGSHTCAKSDMQLSNLPSGSAAVYLLFCTVDFIAYTLLTRL